MKGEGGGGGGREHWSSFNHGEPHPVVQGKSLCSFPLNGQLLPFSEYRIKQLQGMFIPQYSNFGLLISLFPEYFCFCASTSLVRNGKFICSGLFPGCSRQPQLMFVCVFGSGSVLCLTLPPLECVPTTPLCGFPTH